MIRIAKQNDYTGIRSLWEQAFPGYDGFTSYYFSSVYDPARTLIDCEQGQVVSMLQMLTCELQLQDERMVCGYLYAAATERSYRGQGRMKRLITNAHRIMKDEGRAACITIPENAGLFDFYAKLGYNTAFYLQRDNIPPRSSGMVPEPGEDRPGELNTIYEKSLELHTHAVRNRKNWRDIIGEALAEKGGVALGRSSYVIYTVRDGALVVSEAMGKEAEPLAAEVAFEKGCHSCTVVRPAKEKHAVPFACIRMLSRQFGMKRIKSENAPYVNLLHT